MTAFHVKVAVAGLLVIDSVFVADSSVLALMAALADLPDADARNTVVQVKLSNPRSPKRLNP